MRKSPRFLAQNWNRCDFGFFPKFACQDNSFGSLEILDSMFEFADAEKPTIHAKIVSISCTEMTLCIFECLAYLHHCGYVQFSWFLQKKNSWNCLNILINFQMGTRVHGSATYEPSATFPQWMMQSRHEILCYFGLFLSKFGCHGNSLGFLDILDSIFEFYDPENLTIRAKKVLYFLRRTEIGAILSYFCQNLVAMATPLAPLKF